MLNIKVEFNAKQVADVNRVLVGMVAELDDMMPLWNEMQPIIAGAIGENYDRQGNINGKWQRLNSRYLAWKARMGWDTRILHKSGSLRAAATTKDAQHNICNIEPRSFTWGVSSSLPYARIHDVGGQAGRNHAATIPQREYMILNPAAVNRQITRAMAAYVRKSPNLSSGVLDPARG